MQLATFHEVCAVRLTAPPWSCHSPHRDRDVHFAMTRGRSRHPHHELACIWLLRDPRTTVWVAWHPCIPTSPSRWCGALDSAVIPAFAAHAQHSSLTRTTPAGMLLCYTLPGRRIPPAGAPRTAAGWKNTATVSPHPGSSVSLHHQRPRYSTRQAA